MTPLGVTLIFDNQVKQEIDNPQEFACSVGRRGALGNNAGLLVWRDARIANSGNDVFSRFRSPLAGNCFDVFLKPQFERETMSNEILENENLNDDVALEQTNTNDDMKAKENTHTGSVTSDDILHILDGTEKIGIDCLDDFVQQVEKVHFTSLTGKKIKALDHYVSSIAHLMALANKLGKGIGMKNEVPHFYTGEVWKRVDWRPFTQFLQLVGVKQGIPLGIIRDHTFVKKLVKQCQSEAYFPVACENPIPKINLKNGTLHFTAEGAELKAFDKQDGLTYQLHYAYDPSATAPMFKEYFDHVLPSIGLQKLIFQYVAYGFMPDMKLEKMLFLHGDGANGKSVLLDILTALAGIDQCCSYPLKGLMGSRTAEYQRADFGNYLFNFCSEMSKKIEEADVFKKIASREPLQGRYPGGKSFTMRHYATSIFSMNDYPEGTEITYGFLRRFLPVPFAVTIPEEKQDKSLAKKIIQNEMSGVLNLVIDSMKSLLAKGDFDIPAEVGEAVREFRLATDHVLCYIEENGYRPDLNNRISLREMFETYKDQVTADGYKAVGVKAFAKQLRNLGYTVDKYGQRNQTFVFASRQN